MSLTKNKKVKDRMPVALDTIDNKVVYYTPDKTQGDTVFMTDGKFEPYPRGNEIVYITGRRGAGKSYLANIYLNNYYRAHKGKMRLFVISRFKEGEDTSLQLPERSMFLHPSDLIKGDLELGDFANSVMLFDDIYDSSMDVREKKMVHSLLTDACENSRKMNIDIVITSHIPTDGLKTRHLLNEISSMVIFPQFSNEKQIRFVLKEYLSMKKDQIEFIMNDTNTRWIQISTLKPKFILTEGLIALY